MLRYILLLVLAFSAALPPAMAQRSRSDTLMTIPMVSGHFAWDFVGGDMGKRFGNNLEVGGSFMLKTSSNWLFGLEASYLYSDKVRQDVLGQFRTPEGYLMGADGAEADVRTTMRGIKLPVLKAGRVFSMPFGRAGANSGVFVLGGVGFLQHRIHFEDITGTVPYVHDDYRKGLDRLSNGVVLTQQLGYLFLDHRRRLNFFVSGEISEGLTQVRRDFDFVEKRKLDENRLDLFYAVKVGWIFPFYKKLPADFYYY